MTDPEDVSGEDRRRIVVVGPCASGKTTLVADLRGLGYEAHVCGQEHSAVPDLWQRAGPDVLIALDVDLPTLRRRRGSGWPAALYETQQYRLAPAFAAADLVFDTGALQAESIVAQVHRWLLRTAPQAASPP